MNIQITGRHVEVTDALRDYLTAKLEPILAENRQVESVHVILDVQRHTHVAEIVIQARRHVRLEAREQSDDMYKSLDMVLDKVDRQLKRARAKVTDHKAPGQRVKLSDFERQIGRRAEQE
jgi:putative sigma-54 modulation protein